jgi:hypothetical protein
LPLPRGFTKTKREIPSSNAIIAQLAIQIDYLATGRIAVDILYFFNQFSLLFFDFLLNWIAGQVQMLKALGQLASGGEGHFGQSI